MTRTLKVSSLSERGDSNQFGSSWREVEDFNTTERNLFVPKVESRTDKIDLLGLSLHRLYLRCNRRKTSFLSFRSQPFEIAACYRLTRSASFAFFLPSSFQIAKQIFTRANEKFPTPRYVSSGTREILRTSRYVARYETANWTREFTR